MKPYKYCTETIETFTPIIYNVLNMLNGTKICSKLSICSTPKIVIDDDSIYISRVLSSVPPRTPYSENLNSTNAYRILVFTDVHVDFDYVENSSGTCRFNTCCRKDSMEVKNKKNRAGHFAYVGKCDLPKVTLDSFLDK